MEEAEKIKVFVDVKGGTTVCVCMACKKRCEKDCEKTTVSRDLFAGWESTMRRDRFGR